MVKFRLHTGRVEFTGWLPSITAGWEFKDGVAAVPDVDADAAESILCRFYAATREDESNMTVTIYGPLDDAWRDHARHLALQRYPGEELVLSETSEFSDVDLDSSVAVFCVNDSSATDIAAAADERKIPFTLLAVSGKDESEEEDDEGGDSELTEAVDDGRATDEEQQEYVRSVIDLTVKDIMLLLKEEPSIGGNQQMLRAMHSAECDTPAPRRTILAALEEKMETN